LNGAGKADEVADIAGTRSTRPSGASPRPCDVRSSDVGPCAATGAPSIRTSDVGSRAATRAPCIGAGDFRSSATTGSTAIGPCDLRPSAASRSSARAISTRLISAAGAGTIARVGTVAGARRRRTAAQVGHADRGIATGTRASVSSAARPSAGIRTLLLRKIAAAARRAQAAARSIGWCRRRLSWPVGLLARTTLGTVLCVGTAEIGGTRGGSGAASVAATRAATTSPSGTASTVPSAPPSLAVLTINNASKRQRSKSGESEKTISRGHCRSSFFSLGAMDELAGVVAALSSGTRTTVRGSVAG
jgi:hypothetical protein